MSIFDTTQSDVIAVMRRKIDLLEKEKLSYQSLMSKCWNFIKYDGAITSIKNHLNNQSISNYWVGDEKAV